MTSILSNEKRPRSTTPFCAFPNSCLLYTSPYIPWQGGSIILNGSYQTWSCNYSFIYTGERYEAVANIPENYAQPWYTHDFSLSKTFQWGKTGIRVTAEINNIFNQQYEVVQCSI